MNNIFPFLDIIILAFLAIFLGFRLKNLLGDRSGYGEDLKNDENHEQKNVSETRNVIRLDQKKISGKGIEALKDADPSFSEDEFISGAKSAFRIIIDAFSDSITLYFSLRIRIKGIFPTTSIIAKSIIDAEINSLISKCILNRI